MTLGVVVVVGLLMVAAWPTIVERSLIRQVEDESGDGWRAAAEKLLELESRRGLPAVVSSAIHRDGDHFDEWTAKILRAFGGDISDAFPGIRACLESPQQPARRAAIQIVRDPLWQEPELVPILADALESDDAALRWHAAYVLSEMGTSARSAAPALIKALRDLSEHVRWSAARALGELRIVTSSPIEALARAVGDSDSKVAAEAILSLQSFGARAEPAVPALIKALENDYTREIAAGALGSIGARASAASDALILSLEPQKSWSDSVLDMAEYGEELGEIPDIEWSVFRIVDVEEGRASGLLALAQIGVPAEKALPVLERHLASDDVWTRTAALDAVANYGTDAAPVVPVLVHALRFMSAARPPHMDQVESVTNEAAACVLARVGRAAVPALIEALDSSDLRTKIGAAVALAWMGPQAEPAVDALRRRLSVDEPFSQAGGRDFRAALACALKRFEPDLDILPFLHRSRLTPGLAVLAERLAPRRIGRESLRSFEELLSFPSDSSMPETFEDRYLKQLAALGGEELLPLIQRSLKAEFSYRSLLALSEATSKPEILLPVLAPLIDSENFGSSTGLALRTVAALGPAARSLLPRVLRVAEWAHHQSLHPDDAAFLVELWLQDTVPRALAAIAPEDPRVMGSLASRLDDDPPTTACAFLEEVVASPAKPFALVPILERCVEHRDAQLRILAARILIRIHGLSERLLSEIAAGLTDDDNWERQGETWPLRGASELPTTNLVRRLAVDAVIEIGAPAESLVPHIREGLGRGDRLLAARSFEALWRVNGEVHAADLASLIPTRPREAPSVFVLTISFLNSGDPSHVDDVVLPLLREMGSLARDALPALEELYAVPGLDIDYDDVAKTMRAIRGED